MREAPLSFQMSPAVRPDGPFLYYHRYDHRIRSLAFSGASLDSLCLSTTTVSLERPYSGLHHRRSYAQRSCLVCAGEESGRRR